MRAILLIKIFLQACTYNMYLGDHSPKLGVKTYSPPVVRVSNPDHHNYEVLKQSGLFEIVNDDSTHTVLTLSDSEIMYRCGNGLIPPMFTLGILPGYLSAAENFAFTLENHGNVKTVEYYLDIHERYSVWEWFIKPFKANDEETKGKALFIAGIASEN